MATVLLEVGRHIAILMIGRGLQGLAAALVFTTGLGMLADIFGQKRFGEAVGYSQTAISTGTTTAPLLGGVVFARGGYSAVSAMSLVTVSISIILGLLIIEPKAVTSDPKGGDGEDSSSSDGSLRSAGQQGDGPTSPHTGEVITAGQSTHTEDATSPLIRRLSKETNGKGKGKWPCYPKLLCNTRILAAMGGISTYSFVLINLEGMIPLFVKTKFHWNSAHAALTFLSWIIPGFLGPVAGKASDRFGSKWVAIGGLLFAAPSLILMRLVTQNILLHKILLCLLLALVGKS